MPVVQFNVGNKPVRLVSRIVENRHGNAETAAQHWLAGSLWGNPIKVAPNCIHVYGVWKRDWTQIHVCFTNKEIWLIKPIAV